MKNHAQLLSDFSPTVRQYELCLFDLSSISGVALSLSWLTRCKRKTWWHMALLPLFVLSLRFLNSLGCYGILCCGSLMLHGGLDLCRAECSSVKPVQTSTGYKNLWAGTCSSQSTSYSKEFIIELKLSPLYRRGTA